MIGTIGGYIGLFLGYSVLQVPKALLIIVKKIKELYSILELKKRNYGKNHSDIETTESKKSKAHIVEIVGLKRHGIIPNEWHPKQPNPCPEEVRNYLKYHLNNLKI